MPQVEQCGICKKAIDSETEKFIVISKQSKTAPRVIALPDCAKNFNRAPDWFPTEPVRRRNLLVRPCSAHVRSRDGQARDLGHSRLAGIGAGESGSG
jgi:hypothetical protein